MKNLFLFRGLPGSGKSTASRALCSVTLSADDYFTDQDGTYKFNADQIKEAHTQCRLNTAVCMKLGMKNIGVANFFTQEWEMEPYFELAEQYGYTIHTLIAENRHGGSSIHRVPDSVIEKMESRFSVQLKMADKSKQEKPRT